MCFQNVRVIDASIIPQLMGANTNGPVLMIGEKGADLVLKQWGKGQKRNAEDKKQEL